jgi:hypothetical protein
MAFSFYERPSSRDSTDSPPAVTLRYCAQGEHNDAIVKSYARLATPLVVVHNGAFLYRQDISCEPAGFDVYYLTAPYAPKKREHGSFRLTFDTTGGTLNVKCSRSTVASYKQPGDTGDIPNHQGAIGVKSKGKGLDVEGAEIVVPALKITVHFKHPMGVITIPQIKQLARWTGNVNSDTFLTFAPGEVLFLGCKGSEGSDAETEVGYDFACSENLQNKLIGGITVAEKQGWDVYWVQFKQDVDPDADKPISPPEYIYVERVYDRIAMAASLGFGG